MNGLRQCRRKVAGVLLALLHLVTPAKGQAAERDVHPVHAITVSGGVSLGAYEAGFLTWAVYAAPPGFSERLRLLTGTSAGSLNSLLAIMAACGIEEPAPTDTLFWSTWIPVGLDRLFVSREVSPLGVFSRAWLREQAARIEEVWEKGLDSRCDVVLGISATRTEPRYLLAANGALALPRLEEKFAVRIQGRGPGVPPRLTNYTSIASPRRELLLVTDEQGEIAFPRLRDLLFASMAFPIAFAPQPLATCIAGQTERPGVCLPSEARTADFVDGGIFDNAPLRLAASLARDGLEPPGGERTAWRDVPMAGSTRPLSDVVFTLLDPDVTEYAALPAAEEDEQPLHLPQLLGGMLTATVDAARAKELALVLEDEPEVAERLLLPRRNFPAASAPMAAFFGFFETSFRVFDFYLGMYDAQTLVHRMHGSAQPRFEPPLDAPGWRPLGCMRAFFDGEPDVAAACSGDDLADFRILLQVSIDSLYAVCSAAGAEGDEWNNPHCTRAAAGGAPPRVPGLQPVRWPDWRQGPRESDLDHILRLLGAYGFPFRDLGAPAGRSDVALERMRDRFDEIVLRLAEVQPGDAPGAVHFAGRMAANVFSYVPPPTTLHLTLGPTLSEAGLAMAVTRPSFLFGIRPAAALGVRGLQGTFSNAGGEPFAFALTAGPEFRPMPLQSAFLQWKLGVRAGWQWSESSRAVACSSAVGACSRPLVQAVAGATLLELFRVQLVGEYLPPHDGSRGLFSIAPGIGLEFSP